jgi:mRNA-degrading endonuclease toxin of MazEF toxin-antitoxin module
MSTKRVLVRTAFAAAALLAGLPLALKLESLRLPKPSWVKISQVRVLARERLGRSLGRVSAEELEQTIEALFELVA